MEKKARCSLGIRSYEDKNPPSGTLGVPQLSREGARLEVIAFSVVSVSGMRRRPAARHCTSGRRDLYIQLVQPVRDLQADLATLAGGIERHIRRGCARVRARLCGLHTSP
jgi:hypothetical protein